MINIVSYYSKEASTMQNASLSLVSIVITTKNEAGTIERLLVSISKQNYSKIEVIIIDNYSDDKISNVANKYKVSFFHYGPERSAQRNFGAKKAKGKYLFFLDADMELSKNVVSDCVKMVVASRIGAVIVPEQSIAVNFWGRIKAFERSFYNESGDPITDAARFFVKKVFLQAGGYDETITGPEDWDLPETVEELGFRIGRVKSVIYHREKSTSIFSLMKKKYYYALKTHRYLRKHNIPPISAKTVFFLRPIFYKNWIRIIQHPILSVCLILMLSLELLAGSIGYVVGRVSDR